MSSGNGESQARITDSIEGTVGATNERGLHLNGEEAWRNWSRWATRPEAVPGRGQRVRLGLDGSGFIRELQVLGERDAEALAPERAQEIRRLACLNAAAVFCAGKVLVGVDVKSTERRPGARRPARGARLPCATWTIPSRCSSVTHRRAPSSN